MTGQDELRLAFGVLNCKPKAVPTALLDKAKTYRQACRYSL